MQDLNALFDLQNLLVDAISAQEQFERIAKELMVNYGILQKDMPSISNSTRMVDVEYRFLEIEFYYVSENHKDIKANGSPFVYPRNCLKGGTFLLHSSGVDICFKGRVSEKIEECNGGGILIRAMLRTELSHGQRMDDTTTIVAGPWDCADALFNYTGISSFPTIIPLEEKEKEKDIRFSERYHVKGKTTNEFAERKYCAYNEHYHKGNTWYASQKLKRYDASCIGYKANDYAPKPWDRKK